MRFTVATIFTLAISAMAAPSTSLVVKGVPVVPGDVTVAQARDACGDKNTISCCNEVTQTSDTNTAEGVLAGLGLGQGGLLGNLNLVKGCSSIGVAALIGLDELLNQHCKNAVGCCQGNSAEQSGLVNANLPCIALGSLL